MTRQEVKDTSLMDLESQSRNSSQHIYPTQQRPGRPNADGTATQLGRLHAQCKCHGVLKKRNNEVEMDTLQLKPKKKIKVLDGSCIEAKMKDNLTE